MIRKKSYAIGIDLGATTIKAGVVDKKGKILRQFSIESNATKGPKSVIRQIVYSVEELFGHYSQSECEGIGIGSPGLVSVEDGIVKHPPNFADWSEVDLSSTIKKLFKLPVAIDNDANVAALAEAKFGSGERYKDFLFVIWGSGVGGGIIINRKVFHGPSGGAGEIGHITIDYNGPVCNCGNRGCVESYIGQKYLSQRTKEIIQRMPDNSPPSKILKLVNGELSKIEPYYISRAAEEGDQVACEILEEAGNLLGYALASALNILDLNIVIIGGGISAAPRFVFTAIQSTMRARVLKTHQSAVKVLRAQLGNDAGMIGAASLVM
jgi:glucokinase